ncbi:hypothetical protein BH09VER1_BH09VER1_06820 [soil metagenome]
MSQLRVAILHFHLRPGGVTRIIEMAWAALREQDIEVLVISGETPPPSCRIPAREIAVVPHLAYGVDAGRAEALGTEIEEAMIDRWGCAADVIHLHNHALGKNFSLPLAATHWAAEGRALVLHIHDFAENGRPTNYRQLLTQLDGPTRLDQVLYPIGPRVAYAVLTAADRKKLATAGLLDCHLLPNPVSLPEGGAEVDKSLLGADRLIVYPTRAIRRKNVGEALLWATQVQAGEKIVLTVGPHTEADLAVYERWKALAEELRLPIVFDAQALTGRSTVDFLLAAEVCLTTSVGEGFGMAFLEPWLAGRAVAGRDLPGSTDDFREAGVALDDLYTRLEVTVENRAEIESAIGKAVASLCEAYGMTATAEFVRQGVSSVFRNQQADFGRLNEAAQEAVIRRVATRQLEIAVPMGSGRIERIASNKRVIEESYSLRSYGEKLERLYRGLAEAKGCATGHLDAGKVLRANLGFSDFFALRA